MTDSPQARRLLSALRAESGNWVNRRDLARLLNKKWLTSAEMLLLSLMAEEGIIEARQTEISAPLVQRWEYRVSSSE